MTVPIDKLYHIAAELNHLISNEEYVLWVGSGLSKPAGYPTWKETINRLPKLTPLFMTTNLALCRFLPVL